MSEVQEYALDLVKRVFPSKGTRLSMYDNEMKNAFEDLVDMGKGEIKNGRFFAL
jgi:hypothetical protein